MRFRISIRGCVRRSVGPSVPRYFQTRTRRILCRVSGLVYRGTSNGSRSSGQEITMLWKYLIWHIFHYTYMVFLTFFHDPRMTKKTTCDPKLFLHCFFFKSVLTCLQIIAQPDTLVGRPCALVRPNVNVFTKSQSFRLV